MLIEDKIYITIYLLIEAIRKVYKLKKKNKFLSILHQTFFVSSKAQSFVIRL